MRALFKSVVSELGRLASKTSFPRFPEKLQRRDNACLLHITGLSSFSISHFSWAHFPHIQFGLTVDGNKQPETDEPVAATVTAPGSQKAQSFF
ncbi:hypothetical protein BHM03_00021319 [Ensete ventricosum]|nr:hypothetical protein BHM03_00021319 [Ensete ventricosum]